MYMFPEMIDMGLQENQDWPSSSHRIVAQKLLLCNPRVFTRQALMDYCSIINKLTKEEVEKLTIEEAVKFGIPI